MTAFVVRIVLNDATWDDYRKLYEKLGKQGFTDIIVASDGAAYKMPDAEYYFEGNKTRAEVLALAKASAGAVKTSYQVMVTQSAGITWYGLKQLTKAA
jgi:hypothetical protein